MNSRQRVITAINHRQPDKVPVDLGATPSSGISTIAHHNLKKYLNINNKPVRVYDVVQQLAEPEWEIIDRFNIDILDIGRAFNTDSNQWKNITLPGNIPVMFPGWFKHRTDKNGVWYASNQNGQEIAKMPPGATFFDQTQFPYIDKYPDNFKDLPKAMELVMWSAFPVPPWDHVNDDNFWKELREKTLELRSTNKALIIGVGCNLFEWGSFLRRLDNFLMDLVMNPINVEALLDALMELHLATLDKVCKAVGDIADIVKFGDDLGTGTGPIMSPETYRKFFKPRHTKLCKFVRENSKMHTMLHSCGSVYKLIPDLIEAGFEILNPVQTNTRDMDPEILKKEFGREITFWGGGVENVTVLNYGTTEEVRKQVLKRLEIFSKGGGYIFNTVHNILPDVPPENIIAMFKAIKEFNS